MRFKIRDLLWLMVVVGLACGWWLDRRHSVDEMRAERGKYLLEIHRQLNALDEEQRENDRHYKQLHPDKAKARDEKRHRQNIEEWERMDRENMLLPTM